MHVGDANWHAVHRGGSGKMSVMTGTPSGPDVSGFSRELDQDKIHSAQFMHQPAHIDGCTVVILRQVRWGFRVLESGYLSFDGETLSLVRGEAQRPFSVAGQDSLITVAEGNRIPECRGFDLFLMVDPDDLPCADPDPANPDGS
jgi:hypothetical protein